jgi:hypothetical protein
MVETNKINKHPCVFYNIDKNDISKVGLILQTSNKFYDIKTQENIFKKEEARIIVDKGMFNKPGVFNYPPITVDLKTENVKISNIHNLYNVNKISEQKKYFLKAFLLGLYDSDKILLNGVVIESTNYNRYIDRLIDLYNSNELPIDLKQAVDYILDFTYKNNLENDFIKMKI